MTRGARRWPAQLCKSMIGTCIIWRHHPRPVEVRDYLRTAGAEPANSRTVQMGRRHDGHQ